MPLKNRKAQIITKHLENLCINFGTPEIFVSDNAKKFISETLQKFLKESAIKHELTPVYHPQSNPVERVNRDLKTKITAYTTGKTPAFLVYGRESRQPMCWKREVENTGEPENVEICKLPEQIESENERSEEENKHQTRAVTRKKNAITREI